ncbi:DUF768 domain-containing protein [Parvularcula oceani]|uniref:DUF768 domain-containing protein n=1 Tax=Parvularcula oceani TaxID=1247963 RepID=UPI00138DF992|nr:DUF768 domain-containing protein [Parvularcula oceani]
MSERAADFLEGFKDEHVHATGYPQDHSEARDLANQSVAEAEAKGIPRAELDAAADGDLVGYMQDALEGANDAEVQRLADKDD